MTHGVEGRRNHAELVWNDSIPILTVASKMDIRCIPTMALFCCHPLQHGKLSPHVSLVDGRICDQQGEAPLADKTISSNKISQMMYCCLSPRHLIHQGLLPNFHNQFLLICPISLAMLGAGHFIFYIPTEVTVMGFNSGKCCNDFE